MNAPSSLQGNVLAATTFGVCAIDASGQLACWGLFDPFTPPGVFSDVWAGGDRACARHQDAFVECFPEGLGSMVTLSVPPGDFVQAAPNSLTCLLAADGGVACASASGATIEPPDEPLSQVVTTFGWACGIAMQDGTARCWGTTSESPCAQAPTSLLSPPSDAFVELSAGRGHACAIRVDGTLACWGAGTETADVESCPQRVNYGQALPPEGTFLHVAAGEVHTCAIRTDGTLTCWGAGQQIGDCANFFDECGQADPPSGTFALVASAADFSCAMRSDRSIQCWGNDWGGALEAPPQFR